MKFQDYWEKSALKNYSKWFQWLYLLFWPIILILMITLALGVFNHGLALVGLGYVVIFMLTFFIESMQHFVKKSYQRKQNKYKK